MNTLLTFCIKGCIVFIFVLDYPIFAVCQTDSIGQKSKSEYPPLFFEIGTRLNFLSYGKENTNNTDLSGQTYSGNNFIVGISIQSYNIKQFLTRINANYIKHREYNERSSPSLYNGQDYLFTSDYTYQGIEIVPGIGKIITYNSFTFKYGFDFPFYISSNAILINTAEISDSSGNISINKNTVTYPRGYYIKPSIFTELQYNVFKQFFIEIGLLNGVVFSFSNGKSELVNEIFTNGQLSYTNKTNSTIKNHHINTDPLNFHFGIAYRF